MSTPIDESIPSSSEDQTYDDGRCAICLGPHINKSIPNCGHVFCFECLVGWCQNKNYCPTCRQPFQNFRHRILTDPDSTSAEIYTPDPIPPPVDVPARRPPVDVPARRMRISINNRVTHQLWTVRLLGHNPIMLRMQHGSEERIRRNSSSRRSFARRVSRRLRINLSGLNFIFLN